MSFESMLAFYSWKEREEENTYSMYVQDQRPYQPKLMKGMVYVYMYFIHIKQATALV